MLIRGTPLRPGCLVKIEHRQIIAQHPHGHQQQNNPYCLKKIYDNYACYAFFLHRILP